MHAWNESGNRLLSDEASRVEGNGGHDCRYSLHCAAHGDVGGCQVRIHVHGGVFMHVGNMQAICFAACNVSHLVLSDSWVCWRMLVVGVLELHK